ncbi:MAG TPA: glycoside hydrolase family 5 protein [Fibrobacteria bacterium]|nr:glycoside hydrolase family 5 protein [Fibrobacteria bacterium]
MKFNKLFAGLLCLAGLSQALSPVETYGPLQVKSGKLSDSSGTPVTLRGMSLFWHMHNGGKEYWKKPVVKWVMTDWHASVIRAPVGVETYQSGGYTQRGYIDNPEPALTAARTVIDAAIEAGIYVVVDYHAHYAGSSDAGGKAAGLVKSYRSAEQNTNYAVQFFTTLAQEYGNTPNIIWEIWNEPEEGSWSAISTYAKKVIPVIRKYSRNVILVPTGFYCQWAEGPNSDLDDFSNIMYVIHFYAASHTWREKLNQSKPIFVSEWGMTQASGNGTPDAGSSNAWLTDLDAKGISSCNWSLGNPTGGGTTVEQSAALNADASDMGGWTDADLTTSGKFMRNYLRTKNPAWTLSDTTTKVVSALKANMAEARINDDSVLFTASFNKAIPWSIKITGKTSGSSFVLASSSANPSPNVYAKWRAGKRTSVAVPAFQAGETVEAVLTPSGEKVTLKLLASSPVERRQPRIVEMRWKGNMIFLPSNVVSKGSTATVRLIGADGSTSWTRTAPTEFDAILVGERPRMRGVQVLEIQTDKGVFRSMVAPTL